MNTYDKASDYRQHRADMIEAMLDGGEILGSLYDAMSPGSPWSVEISAMIIRLNQMREIKSAELGV